MRARQTPTGSITPMTRELAERILSRRRRITPPLSNEQKGEILRDWLNGMTYKQLMAKYSVGHDRIADVVREAKSIARAFLEKDNEG